MLSSVCYVLIVCSSCDWLDIKRKIAQSKDLSLAEFLPRLSVPSVGCKLSSLSIYFSHSVCPEFNSSLAAARSQHLKLILLIWARVDIPLSKSVGCRILKPPPLRLGGPRRGGGTKWRKIREFSRALGRTGSRMVAGHALLQHASPFELFVFL